MIVTVYLPGITQIAAINFIQARNLRGSVETTQIVTPVSNTSGVRVSLYGNGRLWQNIKGPLQTVLTNNSIPAVVVIIQDNGQKLSIDNDDSPDGPFYYRSDGSPFLFNSDGTVTVQ